MIRKMDELREIDRLKEKLNYLMGNRSEVDDEILELSQKIDKLITAYYKKRFLGEKVI